MPRLPESRLHDKVAIDAFLAFNGVFDASGLLFIRGDLSEVVHEGF